MHPKQAKEAAHASGKLSPGIPGVRQCVSMHRLPRADSKLPSLCFGGYTHTSGPRRCFSSGTPCVDASTVGSTTGSSSSSPSSSALDLIFAATDCQVSERGGSGQDGLAWDGMGSATARCDSVPCVVWQPHADARCHVLRRRPAAGGPRLVLTAAGPGRLVSKRAKGGVSGLCVGAGAFVVSSGFLSLLEGHFYTLNPFLNYTILLSGEPGDGCQRRQGART